MREPVVGRRWTVAVATGLVLGATTLSATHASWSETPLAARAAHVVKRQRRSASTSRRHQRLAPPGGRASNRSDPRHGQSSLRGRRERNRHLHDLRTRRLATSGLGLSTCSAATLESHGPPGCPSNSVMGPGSGLAEVPLGHRTLYEPVKLTTFMAPLQDGHLGLLFFTDGESPVNAEWSSPA